MRSVFSCFETTGAHRRLHRKTGPCMTGNVVRLQWRRLASLNPRHAQHRALLEHVNRLNMICAQPCLFYNANAHASECDVWSRGEAALSSESTRTPRIIVFSFSVEHRACFGTTQHAGPAHVIPMLHLRSPQRKYTCVLAPRSTLLLRFGNLLLWLAAPSLAAARSRQSRPSAHPQRL